MLLSLNEAPVRILYKKIIAVSNVIAASCHCVALDVQGRCYTWGRNEVPFELNNG